MREFAHSFIHQTLDQQDRGPTKDLQNLGGDQTKQSVDPGPEANQNGLTHGHTYYKNKEHEYFQG